MHRYESHRAATACNLCHSSDGTLIAVEDRDGQPLAVTCCRSCGLAYVDPMPSRDELARFYAQRYRLEYKRAARPRLKHVHRAGKVALARLDVARRLASPPARVLECGAGGGEFSYLLASRGYRLTGIEPNDGYREYAAAEYGVDLRPGTIDDNDFAAGEFDLITLFHVLEHVPDPGAALVRLAGWLRSGGHLYIEVPNALTAVSSPANLYHRAHLYYFSAAPLVALAGNAGLTAITVEGDPGRANLTATFVKTAARTVAPIDAGPAAHDAVVAANRQRTLARYLTAPSTLSAVVPRLRALVEERQVERSGLSGRAALDRLYRKEGFSRQVEA